MSTAGHSHSAAFGSVPPSHLLAEALGCHGTRCSPLPIALLFAPDYKMAVDPLSVFVRVRPMNEAERQRGAFECVSVVDKKRLLLVDPEKFSGDALRQNRQHEREFRFDAVMGPATDEAQVQQLLGGEGLVEALVSDGRNGTVLAYGPTGTGKTHTMVGTRERPGLMMRMTRALYERLAETGDRQTRVFISFMELYNEHIRDLLRPERHAPLELLEDEHGNVQVPNLSRMRASNMTKLLQLLHEGNARRTQEPTAANATSSRSHALLLISLWRGERQRGKLYLIDLAGSERASNTQNQGQRLKEGAAINRSLLALGNVINALSSNQRRSFVNFRDSKLTRLLKDSLGGAGENGARTVLLAHASPSSTHYDETFNTLTYASRAKQIGVRPAHNTHRPASADRSYSEAVEALRREAQRAGRLDAGSGGGSGPQHAASTGRLDELEGGSGRERARRRTVVPNQSPLAIPPLAIHQTSSPARQQRNQQTTTTGAGSTPQQPQKLPRMGTSLFDSLRDQYLAQSERQQKLRERLLRANTEHYELEMARQARMAILEACERGGDDTKYEKAAERVRRELEEQEQRLSTLGEQRQKVEAALRRGEQGLRSLEQRMRSLSREPQQQQVVELVCSLARQQAERAAIHSDFALQGRRLRHQESLLRRVRRYERVTEALIEQTAELDETERKTLKREYRLLRGQMERLGGPVESALPSWNAQILARMDGREAAGGGAGGVLAEGTRRRQSDDYGSGDHFGKTFTVLRAKAQNNGNNAAERSTTKRSTLPELGLSTETRSEVGENHSPPESVASNEHLPPLS